MADIFIKIYNGDVLVYEGVTRSGKPYGEGIAYYKDGRVFQKGIFGIKGLVNGCEYYPGGQIKFDGEYVVNPGYGPNYPLRGKLYSPVGKLIFSGNFKVERSGLGYPKIIKPKEYTTHLLKKPDGLEYAMWEDINGS